MLGEIIGEETGQITVQRVIANPGGIPKMETTFRGTLKLLGIEAMHTGTYIANMRADGTLYGDGQGLAMGKQGEMASWTGSGVGTFQKDGSLRFRGAIYYQSAHPSWTRLNAVAAVFEYEANPGGATKSTSWEWK